MTKMVRPRLTIPKTVSVVELENAPFKCAKDADAWARSHGIVGLMSNVDTAGKGEVAISVHSLNKMLSGSALEKSSTPALHFAALMRLRDIIRESFVAEVHPDYIKVNGKRSPANGVNPLVEIWVLYGCASFADFPCRVKTTLKRFLDNNFPSKAYTYEISNIEILKGTAAPVARPSDKISMDVSILLNGVCDVNGTPLLDVCEIENTAADVGRSQLTKMVRPRLSRHEIPRNVGGRTAGDASREDVEGGK